MIDLSGTWSFALDPHGKGEQEKLWNMDFAETVTLPGTTDSNRKGIENTNKSETTYLSRYYKYEGAAWYSRNIEIPADWKEKHIVLFLERTRPTTVWIDGREVGKCNYLSTPQEFNLTHFLAPGSHKLTICVDNGKSIPGQIRSSSHACTESTQTNWNGIIGRMELQAMNPLFIESIQAFPQVEDRSVKVKITLSNSSGIGGKKLQLSASAFNTAKKHKARSAEYNLKEGSKEYEFTRHNAGFLCLDLFAQENDIKINRLKFNALIGDTEICDKRCILAKPQTFMNNSGEAVRDIASFYKIPPEKIIVIFDDISLPCGRLRIRRKGTDGGHNGIKSIIYQLQSDQFPRIKLGIGAKLHPEQPLADWVLSVMKGDDLENLRSACLKACDAIPLLVNGETEKAMGLYNAAK